jgi:hypothetical protein
VLVVVTIIVVCVTAHLFCILQVFHFVLQMSETPYSLLSL